MKKIVFAILSLLLCSTACTTDVVEIDNGKLALTFDARTATLRSMVDKTTGYEYIDGTAEVAPLWTLTPLVESEQFELPTEVRVTKLSSRKVRLAWRQASGEGIELTATVRLDKHKALSYWTVELCNYDGEKVKHLNFPYVRNIKQFTDEKVLISDWTGYLFKNPRKDEPTLTTFKRNHQHQGTQLSAIYGDEPSGLYIATNDTQAYGKSFNIEFHDALTDYKMVNVVEVDAAKSCYKPAYEFILGAFQGDWYDAAIIYREWALQQEWVKNCRLRSGKMNPWLPETDVWVWNRGRSDNVLKEAADLKELLGDCNVSVLWHWWHNGPYDDAFPEYLPPREGRESFVKAVAEAKAKGINMTPYMNSIQWGNSTKSWSEYNVERLAARNPDGSTLAHVYNKFTENPITPMCLTQEFWRETYATLSDSVVNRYGCTGIYMDQSCNQYWCYCKDHGHTVGGGNYWAKSHHKLIERIREKCAEANPVLTGEGAGESWLPYLDGFLTLEGSRERMRGPKASEIVPVFNAIYHGYAICLGNLSGLTYPPYDDLWPMKYRSPNTEKLMPEKFNTQMRMEQARTFVWGTQPMISNYHPFVREGRPVEIAYLTELVKKRKQYKDYLQYGTMLRPPKMANDYASEIDVAQMNIYNYKTAGTNLFPFKKVVPMLYSSAWRNNDGDILLVFTNISEEAKELSFTICPAEIGFAASGTMLLDGKEVDGWPQNGCEWGMTLEIGGCSTKIFEFKNSKQ